MNTIKVVAAAVVLTLFSSAAAGAFQLLSHRAVYDLSLAPGRANNVAGVSGRIVLEWVDVCEGYTTRQRMLMRVQQSDGRGIESDFRLISWESKDGDIFRFDVRNFATGSKPVFYKGLATRAPGKAKADFRLPKKMALELPKGVVFPSEQVRRLIDGATAGEKSIPHRLFDGTGEEGMYQVSGLVLGPREEAEPAVAVMSEGALKGVPAWQVRLSFFGFDAPDSLPEYEVSLRLFANGVSDKLILDFGAFSVAGSLTDVVAIPAEEC